MELMDAIRGRRSIRVFDGKPVDRMIIDGLVEAATYAPSRMNAQPWHFHVAEGNARTRVIEALSLTTSYLEEYLDVLGPEGVQQVARFYADLGNAPVVIGISSPLTLEPFEARDFAISVGAALENFLLAAEDKGLGACGISVPHWVRDRVADAFEVPKDREIVALVVLGYADEVPHTRVRNVAVVTYLT